MRPFTHDADEELPFDEDDEWDLEYGDEEEGGGGAHELPDDDWETASVTGMTGMTKLTGGGSMRVRILGLGLAVIVGLLAPEWAGAQPAGTPPAASPDAAKLSLPDLLEQRFKQLDANGNGNIESEEFTAGRNKEPAKKRAQAAFQRLDADKNGVVSKEEFTSRGSGKPGTPAPAKAVPSATPVEG